MDLNAMYLGIDIGGTSTKVGVVDASGDLIGKTRFSLPELQTEAQCRQYIAQIIDFVHGTGVYASELAGVGLAAPGIVVNGIPQLTPNVKADWPTLLNVIRSEFEGTPFECINDANAAALGEMWRGAASGAQSAMLVTIGAGIGAGIVADGRVVQGHGGAGEIGHMTIVPEGRQCQCGRRGCVEQYASSRGIVANFREAEANGIAGTSKHVPQNDTDALSVFEAYREGDPRATYAVGIFTDKLGYALAQATCVVDADVILLGGGVAGAADLFLPALQGNYRKNCLSTCADTQIRVATLGNIAGMVGVVRYVQMMSESLDPFDNLFGMGL